MRTFYGIKAADADVVKSIYIAVVLQTKFRLSISGSITHALLYSKNCPDIIRKDVCNHKEVCL